MKLQGKYESVVLGINNLCGAKVIGLQVFCIQFRVFNDGIKEFHKFFLVLTLES
jgi:hypothetical protein